MTKWGQGDNNFNAILRSAFGSESPKLRKYLFYFVCIIVRLFLYIFSATLVKYDWFIILVLLLALFATYNLIKNLSTNQWWSKKFQLFISVCLIIASLVILFKFNINRKIISYILLFSLFGGILQSINNL